MRVGGVASVDGAPEDQTSLNTRQVPALSQHVAENSQVGSADDQQELKNLKLVIELLDKKL